ncbi:D-serine deaminase-like pyridoxal phosphate-dependent protein [Streptosporangium becharense]|uniref:D-serine deaminase-like pyridoxal phosphate-dependent protein n=1 Tax=Streptosporangium becharense TaxID=1816182 RepID=A0A7W9MG35_9ACTN|nr:amino acid deaminase/aldolase [Streptosporangium becharense]MBB2910001.1 D-serine deaminase-like pyridoxal phosphate-dependent protein [Streptosporangium becharense]MBB5819044.1 D-serine deaminase-like pyridoxal phosphate-dependent protein [Streptosporangium becharense]
MDDRRRYDHATAHLDPPFAILDLRALRANAEAMVARAAGKPIRVASKSIRSRAVLERILAMDGFSGIMAFTLPEALWLVSTGMRDVLLAYPTADRAALAELAADPRAAQEITVMVDRAEHLDVVESAIAGVRNRHEIRVCMDIDAGFVALGGRFRAGARRSPVREPDQVADLAADIAKRPGFRLAGLMAYEAQIAGVGDDAPGNPALTRAIRWMQARSQRELTVRRGRIVQAVREIADLEFVNGGGTGSIEKTARERAITEIAAGSGFYHPRLFDFYRGFTGRPAALFALPVVRRPAAGVVTVLGGGYPASGKPGPDRLPQPYLPCGLRYDPDEGAGEVQTPLVGQAAEDLRVGDRVWFRHAKAGELCERFAGLHLIEGDEIVAEVPTYRGEGRTFL